MYAPGIRVSRLPLPLIDVSEHLRFTLTNPQRKSVRNPPRTDINARPCRQLPRLVLSRRESVCSSRFKNRNRSLVSREDAVIARGRIPGSMSQVSREKEKKGASLEAFGRAVNHLNRLAPKRTTWIRTSRARSFITQCKGCTYLAIVTR